MAQAAKVRAGATGFGAVVSDVSQAGEAIGSVATDRLLAPWKAYATAVGQSAPANVNRATRAIRAIRGSGK